MNMGQQGIYVAPCDNVPNRDRESLEKAAIKEQKLWSVKFTVKGVGKGVAVVKAKTPIEAEYKLKAEGMYNGSANLYDIESLEEIIPSPDSMLISEQILEEES